MSLRLSIICSQEVSDNDKALAGLAGFLGVPTRFSQYAEVLAKLSDGRETAAASAVSGETLTRLMGEGLMGQFREYVGRRLSTLLVYGIRPGESIGRTLDRFTEGLVRGVLPLGSSTHGYYLAKGEKEFSRQFSGMLLEPRKAPTDYVFDVVCGEGGTRDIISIEGRPFFSSFRLGGCRVFMLAAGEIADVGMRLSEPVDTGRFFSRLIPPAMYIKHAFGDAAWHSEKDRACLIVDDPLLREKYGFLNYRTLASLMDCFDFTASIGFIPWNFRRTAGEVARLFNARSDRFSLCIHGCDHTRSEFGSLDDDDLARMTRTATERMNRHKKLTGVTFDRIMVFPQGVFSTRAMEVLNWNGYLAAVNSEPFPVDFNGSLPLTSFLEPAVTAFGGFPLFLRRWPEDIEDLATDLFWGRPALITAHHDFFREGCRRVVELLSKIASINTDLEWRSLGEIVRRSHLLCAEPDGAVRVRSYVSDIVIRNDGPLERVYLITMPTPGPSPVRVVSQGDDLRYEISDDGLRVPLVVPPYRETGVAIVRPWSGPDRINADTRMQAVKILMRRYLSEIRDNYISKNSVLLAIAMRLKDGLSVLRRPDDSPDRFSR